VPPNSVPRLRYVFRASNYDAWLVLITFFAAIFIGIEFSILVGVGLSILSLKTKRPCYIKHLAIF
jgi:MFS superfamily sulfate permease-like transporter